MNITFYRTEADEEIEVSSWREADHCISVFGACGSEPYVEVFKAAKN